MLTDIRLMDFVKDYEYEEFNKMVVKSNKGQTDSSRVRKVTEPISLRQMKNESKNRRVDCTPIDLSDYENDPKANDELQNLFNEIMNDIRKKENDLKVKFNNGTISFEKYTHLMNELSKSKRKTREAYMKNAR